MAFASKPRSRITVRQAVSAAGGVKEVAAILGVALVTVYAWKYRGGKVPRIPKEHEAALLEAYPELRP